MSLARPTKPMWREHAIRIAVWLASWGFLIPVVLFFLIYALIACGLSFIGEFINSWPIALSVSLDFAFPVLALVGLIAGFWTWRTRIGIVRLLVLAITVLLYWHLYGHGIAKYVSGGMG